MALDEMQPAIPLCSNLHIPSGIGLTPFGVKAFFPGGCPVKRGVCFTGVQPAEEKRKLSSSLRRSEYLNITK
jgi:hypothetical protein